MYIYVFSYILLCIHTYIYMCVYIFEYTYLYIYPLYLQIPDSVGTLSQEAVSNMPRQAAVRDTGDEAEKVLPHHSDHANNTYRLRATHTVSGDQAKKVLPHHPHQASNTHRLGATRTDSGDDAQKVLPHHPNHTTSDTLPHATVISCTLQHTAREETSVHDPITLIIKHDAPLPKVCESVCLFFCVCMCVCVYACECLCCVCCV